MSRKSTEQLWVWLDDPSIGPLQQLGTLSKGQRGTLSFAYTPTWLEQKNSFELDPELELYDGEFFPENSNFGIFTDSCPDRWGRKLMDRREALEARAEKRPKQNLTEWDYLLGVQDLTRMGALRYSYPGETVFQSNELLAAPPITKIAELQYMAHQLTRKKHEDLSQVREWLKALVAPGASLGGARPKANILENDGQLWIAKFPSANDSYDVAAWEMTLHHLAEEAGLNVAPAKLVKFSEYQTFLTKRFDRHGKNRSIFVSAMTLLKKTDKDEASYLELADFLATHGNPDTLRQNLEELFRRVVFNAMTANRDDHLRNHGFIRTLEGWELSPAYDMNPSFKKEEHELSFDTVTVKPDIETIIETAEYYFLTEVQATAIASQVAKAVTKWEAVAKRFRLSAIERVEAANLFDTFGMSN